MSTATSPQEKQHRFVGLRQLHQQFPREAVAAIAHMRVLSFPRDWRRLSRIFESTWAVIGNLIFPDPTFLSSYARLMPSKTLLSTRRDELSRGSRKPWRFRTAER